MRYLVNIQTNKNVKAFGSKSLCMKKLYLEEKIMDVIAVTFMVKTIQEEMCHAKEYTFVTWSYILYKTNFEMIFTQLKIAGKGIILKGTGAFLLALN